MFLLLITIAFALPPIRVRDITDHPLPYLQTLPTDPPELVIPLESSITIPLITLPPVTNTTLPDEDFVTCEELPECINIRKMLEKPVSADDEYIQTQKDEIRQLLW